MIKGVGTDLIEIRRIAGAFAKQRFQSRCYTQKELQEIGNNPIKAAGNFAVKEAVSKVFGTGICGFELNEIEVLRDQLGKPYINLHGQALVLAMRLGIEVLHVSISNTKEHALAFVVGEGD